MARPLPPDAPGPSYDRDYARAQLDRGSYSPVSAALLDRPRRSEATERTHSSGWQRFLFEDADFDVARSSGTWRLRRLALDAESSRFDEALAELIPSLSNHRIAEVTVQVLDWYAHADTHA